jgi:ribonuclease-3
VPHRFRDPALLAQALRHRSAGSPHNERLEFLGDGLLAALTAELLYRRYPGADEGRLSRMRSRLVRREALAAAARRIALGEHLELGAGELASGGFRRESILADALEAVIAAVYLDAGWAACAETVAALLEPELTALSLERDAKDAKTRLQEWVQGRHLALPRYRPLAEEGPDHDRCYTIECEAGDPPLRATGRGRSRREAEQAAAQALLELLHADEPRP